MRHFKQLTFTDRLKIEAWEQIGTSPKTMAAELGVHISTIYRELKRGRYDRLNTDLTTTNRYSPDIAERKYQEQLRAKGPALKLANDHVFAEYLEYKIKKEKYAPGAILGEIKRKGMVFNTTISKTTFYRYIDDGVFLTVTNKDLPVKGHKKKKPAQKRPARAPRGTSIEKRPPEINARESFGHWEMDCVVGKQGTKKTLLVLTERITRQEIIRLMKDKTAQSVVKALDGIERKMGARMFEKVFKTITVDNGTEFSDCHGIERHLYGTGQRTRLYFCHPYSAYERGSNENQNKMIRRHYPKGCDFSKVKAADIRKLETWINNYPREIFNYCSSADLYEAYSNELLSA